MLTMRIAEDALSGFQTVTQIIRGTERLDGIRFGTDSGSSNFLSITADGEDVLLNHRDDRIRVLNTGIDRVANAVLNLTERLVQWDADLNRLIYEGAPLQALVDRSLEHFRNPIFIIDETNTVRARTAHEIGSVSDDWDYIVENNRMPIDCVRAIYNSNQVDWFSPLKTSKPFLYSPPGMAHRGINYRIPSADGSKFTGTLIIIEHETPVTVGMLQYAGILAEAVKTWVRRHSGERHMYTVSDMLADLIDGVKLPGGSMLLLDRVVSPPEHTYRIACAINRDALRVSQYLHLIEERLTQCVCCEHGDLLVILFDDSKKNEVFKTLSALFLNLPVSFGVSNPFTDLLLCGSCLRQAQISVRCGNQKISELDAQSVMKYISSETYDLLHSAELTHPVLRQLKNYDIKHRTQMYKTLWVFLRNERSLARSLQELNIHRNSLIYRLDRISQIAECDLDDPDIREWLLFSFRMADNVQPCVGTL